MTEALGSFALAGALDWLYARYTQAVRDKAPAKSATLAAILYAVGGLLTLTVVGDPINIIPACAGAWVGTWVAVEADRGE